MLRLGRWAAAPKLGFGVQPSFLEEEPRPHGPREGEGRGKSLRGRDRGGYQPYHEDVMGSWEELKQ